MKRLISIILSAVMLFSAAGVAVSADEAQTPVQEESQGSFVDNAVNALGFFKFGINDTNVFLEPTQEENVSEFCISYSQNNGENMTVNLGAFYNDETGEVYGTNYGQGVFDTGFGYNAHTQYFYATNDCWQRQLGFTPLYDVIAKIAFDYTTKRIFFDYDGKEWMIQIWKGNYAFDLFVGGEIGVYNRPKGSFGMFYNCASDEEMMPISIKVYSDERVYVDREAYLTWWATGFVLADPVEPKSLTMDSSIKFPNEEMCSAFVEAAKKVTGVNCAQNGQFALFIW